MSLEIILDMIKTKFQVYLKDKGETSWWLEEMGVGGKLG